MQEELKVTASDLSLVASLMIALLSICLIKRVSKGRAGMRYRMSIPDPFEEETEMYSASRIKPSVLR